MANAQITRLKKTLHEFGTDYELDDKPPHNLQSSTPNVSSISQTSEPLLKKCVWLL